MSEFIRNLSSSNYATIHRRAMDDEHLSISARGVLGWLCTRPSDHKIVLSYAMRRWGITQPTWRRIRMELEAAGYLKITKVRRSGRFVWTFTLTDIPASSPTSESAPAPKNPKADQEGEFAAALKQVAGELEEWRFQADSKRAGSITPWHLRKNCMPQLRQIHERNGVEGLREALNTAAYLQLRDFRSILNGSVQKPLQ